MIKRYVIWRRLNSQNTYATLTEKQTIQFIRKETAVEISPELRRQLSNLAPEDLDRLTVISREELHQSLLDCGITDPNVISTQARGVLGKSQPKLNVLRSLID